MKKRLLSLALCLALCLGLLPVGVLATDGESGGVYVPPGGQTEGGGGTYIPQKIRGRRSGVIHHVTSPLAAIMTVRRTVAR